MPLDNFRREHAAIETMLRECADVKEQPAVLIERLKASRAMVMGHLDAKDAFYTRLLELCTARADVTSRKIVEIFQQNMRVQSGALRNFFDSLETSPTTTISSSFATMADVLRSRVGTEERAVFPLYTKNAKPQ